MTTSRPPSRAIAPALAAARLRAAGLAETAPRVAILRALSRSLDHPSPEALHARLQVERPDLSLATVYKALHAFVSAGIAHEVSVAGDNRRRFDANLESHQHLVCTGCHAVRDVYDARLAALEPPAALGGFDAQTVHVSVLGRCAGCVAKPRARAPRAPRPPRRRPRTART